MFDSVGPMRGRVVDLATTTIDLPVSVILDTNILAALLMPNASDLGELQRRRAEVVLHHLVAGARIGYVATQSTIEFAH